MLAQSFLKAEVLGITEQEQAALVKVLGMLERGELVHVEPEHAYDNPSITNGFNMVDYDFQQSDSTCGTVCCIAGWADRLYETEFVCRHGDSLPEQLNDLFFGPDRSNNRIGSVGNEDVTTAQACIALRNYLTTGEPRWKEAMASQ